MYTTQLTQKAKKFHDGVLKLASSGSQGRQEATLIAEDGTILSRRCLKLLEDIKDGGSFNMTNYLVKVGEPRKLSEGEYPRKASTLDNETPEIRSKACKRVRFTVPLSDGKPSKTASSLQDTDSKVRNSSADKVMSSMSSNDKPIRDGEPPKTAYSLQDTDSKFRNSATDKVMSSNSNSRPVHDGEPPKTAYSLQDTDSKVRNSATDKVMSSYSYNMPIRDAHSILSFLKKPTTSKSVFIEKEHESGSQYQAEKQQDPCSKISEETVYNKETRPVDVGVHPVVSFFRGTSSLKFNEPAKENKDQSNTEISGANMTVDSRVHDASIDTRKGFEHTNSTDEFPSFDLGFD